MATLTIGIVGLPNVGKSTLFNALTKNDVLAANYPFATIEPNVGVVGLPDARLDRAGRAVRLRKGDPGAGRRSSTSPAWSAARPRGRAGATRSWPTSARRARSARSSGCSPTPTSCTSTARSRRADDIETINTELILADLQTIEKALPRLEKEAKLRKDRRRPSPPRPRRRASCSTAARRSTPARPRRHRRRAAARAAPADRQAVPVRLQRRRGRAGQRRPSWTSCARWSRRPRRSSWTPRSSPS